MNRQRLHILTLLTALFVLLPYSSTIKWPPSATFWAEWVCIFIASALTAIMLSARIPSEKTLQIPALFFSYGVLIVILIAQLITRPPDFQMASLIATTELIFAAFLFVSIFNIRTEASFPALAHAFSIGLLIALFVNTIAVLLELSGWQIYINTVIPAATGQRALGLFGQPNQLAVFSVIGWAAAHHLWLCQRLPYVLHMAASLCVAIIGAASASRAGSLIWLAIVGLAWAALRGRSYRSSGQRLLLLAILLYLVVGVGYAAFSMNAGATGSTVLRQNPEGRIALWRDALSLIARHPLSGVGFGNYSGARWSELSASLIEPTTTHAHNIVLQLACELGVPVALLVLIPLGWMAWHCVKAALSAGAVASDYLCASIALAIILYSLVEYPLWYTYFLLPLSFALGGIEQPTIPWRPNKPSRILVFLGGIVAVAGLMLVAIDYSRIESLYTRAAIEAQQSKEGVATIPNTETRQIALLTVFDVWAELMLSRTLDMDGILTEDKLRIARRVELSITNGETVARYIAFLAIAGRDSQARAEWERTARGGDLRTATFDMLKTYASSHPAISAFVHSLPDSPTTPESDR